MTIFSYCLTSEQEISMRFPFTVLFLAAVLLIIPGWFPKAFGADSLMGGLKVDVVSKSLAEKSSWKGQKVSVVRVPNTTDHLSEFFRWFNHDLQESRKSVQPVFVERFPPDFDDIQSVARRKEMFTRIVLPLILRENNRILDLRSKVQDLVDEPVLTEREEAFLASLYKRYKIDDIDIERSGPAALLSHIDVIPPGLALAQAAHESGWGRSRFSRKGNALYGQWTWSEDDPGFVPSQRGEGKTHKVKAFETLNLSVRSYMLNLNRHQSYSPLRKMRTALRATASPLDSYVLAEGLIKYSEKRGKYVDYIQTLILQNNFSSFDKSTLKSYIELPEVL